MTFTGFGTAFADWVAEGVRLALEFGCEVTFHPFSCRLWMSKNPLWWWAQRRLDARDERIRG